MNSIIYKYWKYIMYTISCMFIVFQIILSKVLNFVERNLIQEKLKFLIFNWLSDLHKIKM